MLLKRTWGFLGLCHFIFF